MSTVSGSGSSDTPNPRWKVRLWHGSRLARIWEVYEPDGQFSGAFEAWDEAIQWATSPSTRLKYLLENQHEG